MRGKPAARRFFNFDVETCRGGSLLDVEDQELLQVNGTVFAREISIVYWLL